MEVLMKCGHTSMFMDAEGKPCCAICDCYEIEENQPSLEGRIAKCSYCKNERPSSYLLPFFKYRPDKDCDEYYCGCFGWD